MNWEPDEIFLKENGSVKREGNKILTVQKLRYRRWIWWVHVNGKCVATSVESTELKAKKAAEKIH